MEADRLNPITLRPTVLDVDLDAISHNFSAIKQFVEPAGVAPVVKANAYGHGLVTCGRLLEKLGAPLLCVGFVEEGIELRQAGISCPILVFGGISGAQIKYFLEYDLELTAPSVGKLEAIEETAKALGKRARVHLKVDTGMERIGIHYYTADSLFLKTLECKHCDIVGVYSHFACAEHPDGKITKLQLERFLECLHFFEKRSLPMPKRHIANTSGLLASRAAHLDLVRPGIGIYGLCMAPHLTKVLPLKPAMTLRSQIVYFKVVKKGAGVSYDHTWTAPADTRVVTVPIGHGDGYARALSNKGHVLIRGKRCPIVGNVCMDQIMVNIGNGAAYNGDEVVLIGKQEKEEITVGEIADLCQTNMHEVLVSTNLRVPRRYISS